MASPETYLGQTGDGYHRGANTSDYATARAMTSSSLTTTALRAGQTFSTPNYYCYESPLVFETSALPDDCTITAVTLSLYLNLDNSTTDFTANVYAVANANVVAGADLSALTKVASLASSGIGAAGYKAFTSLSAFLSALNKSGTTYLLVASDRHEAGTQPSGAEYLVFEASAYSDTTRDPKLVIEYTSGGVSYIARSIGAGIGVGIGSGIG